MRGRKSKKNRQHNSQKTKGQQDNTIVKRQKDNKTTQ